MTMCTQCTEVLIVDIAGDAEKFGKRKRPWYADIENCISTTKPSYRPIDPTQIDNR